jgi:hypothetical protein
MPVTTRSQHKNAANALLKQEQEYKQLEGKFAAKIKEYSLKNNAAIGEENQMRYVLKAYKLVNKSLPELIAKHPNKYIKFSAAIFNKSTDLLIESNEGKWEGIDRALVKKMRDEIFKSRILIMPIIRYCDEQSSDPAIKKAKLYISNRNRRIDL